jgi:hypothetical protein
MDCGSKPAWANTFARPYLKKKKKSQKRVGGVAQGLEFTPQYR